MSPPEPTGTGFLIDWPTLGRRTTTPRKGESRIPIEIRLPNPGQRLWDTAMSSFAWVRRLQFERTSLAPEATRGARRRTPWGHPCPPRDCPAADHSGALGTRRVTHPRGTHSGRPGGTRQRCSEVARGNLEYWKSGKLAAHVAMFPDSQIASLPRGGGQTLPEVMTPAGAASGHKDSSQNTGGPYCARSFS